MWPEESPDCMAGKFVLPTTVNDLWPSFFPRTDNRTTSHIGAGRPGGTDNLDFARSPDTSDSVLQRSPQMYARQAPPRRISSHQAGDLYGVGSVR
jgi:hypothetical protein